MNFHKECIDAGTHCGPDDWGLDDSVTEAEGNQ